MKGRMILLIALTLACIASILACQPPTQLTPSAADQVDLTPSAADQDDGLTPSAVDQAGVASVYSLKSGSATTSGERLDREALTAAHRTLPFGTKVKVTNKSNGRSVTLTINDRGPFVHGRVIDVTPAAARLLGFSGLAQVAIKADQ